MLFSFPHVAFELRMEEALWIFIFNDCETDSVLLLGI